jgi:hypothetical protein
MTWQVLFHDDFEAEFHLLDGTVQDELLTHAKLLQTFGPGLGRPIVDTLKGAVHTNLKELRFRHGAAVWRVAFAFDPLRQAILLVAGNKAGADQRLFYRRFIQTADQRLQAHLASLIVEKKHGKKSG